MDSSGLQIPDKQRLSEQYHALVPIYEGVLDRLHHSLKRELVARELHATVKTRVKSFESYYRKLLLRMSDTEASGAAGGSIGANGIGDSAEIDGSAIGEEEDNLSGVPGWKDLRVPITDVMGVRIVCPFLEQVETACDYVRSHYEVIHSEEKGADQSFREFGYQSTHFLIRVPADFRTDSLPKDSICEVQVCTLLQDAWAEVEHELIYKAEFTPFDEPLRRKLAALNANLTLSDIIFQEIRDYQRRLHAELLKRRRDFLDRVQSAGKSPIDGRSNGEEELSLRNGSSAALSLDDLLLSALHAHNARKYSVAIKLYTRILESEPSTNLEAIVLVHRGMAHFANEDYGEALEDFKAAIKTDPQNGKAFYYRGIVYRMNRDYRKALRDFDRSLELSPYEFDTLLSRSRIHLELGNLPKALEDCDNALRIEPKEEEALALRLRLISETK